ncbi:porin [Fulvivirga maritima]|uniref:porin n=1 Tax=Fulvivirga maritima TaxID=2904247 RepID=UPI001F2DC182|nr:outer membrane beta-barrel protein [Fulvivirga maritima]UII29214.1 porin [Fulvivirga maritima]
MKKYYLLLLMATFLICTTLKAQDDEIEESTPLSISGSVDTYYKYDFSGNPNIPTSFASDQNSFSIGMVNLIASQQVGKASFVGDISFGPRGQGQSILNSGADDNSFHIQNLYVAYQLSDLVTVSAGYMGTFVGYEVISPTGNFNYSTSYLFTSGPFQNAGLKFDFALSEKFGLMVGVFNDWNEYTDMTSSKDIGLQLSYSPAEGYDLYFNLITGEQSGTEFDITAGLQFTEYFYLGVNAATYGANEEPKLLNTAEDTGFYGLAVYPQVKITDVTSLGFRFEHFVQRDAIDDISVDAFTFSANIGSGNLKFIPELRYDTASEDVFADSDNEPTGGAFQLVAAAVYSF